MRVPEEVAREISSTLQLRLTHEQEARLAPARDGGPGGLPALPEGPLPLEQAHGRRLPAGHRVLRAGERAGPGLRAAARRPRRHLRADGGLQREPAGPVDAQGAGRGRAGAGARRPAGRGARDAGPGEAALRLGPGRVGAALPARHLPEARPGLGPPLVRRAADGERPHGRGARGARPRRGARPAVADRAHRPRARPLLRAALRPGARRVPALARRRPRVRARAHHPRDGAGGAGPATRRRSSAIARWRRSPATRSTRR